jgi:hypothetical protein
MFIVIACNISYYVETCQSRELVSAVEMKKRTVDLVLVEVAVPQKISHRETLRLAVGFGLALTDAGWSECGHPEEQVRKVFDASARNKLAVRVASGNGGLDCTVLFSPLDHDRVGIPTALDFKQSFLSLMVKLADTNSF